MRAILVLAVVVAVCGDPFDDDTYHIYIHSTKGNITKEKLTTKKDVGVLDISFATIEGIEPSSFCALPNLKTLYINGNSKFPRVTKELFQCNPKLSYVTFVAYEDAHQQMDRNAFTDLKQLNLLRINGVIFKRIGKDMFTGLDLEILNLVSCNIEEIDADAFSTLTNLKELHLGHNQLKNFKPGTYQNLPKLTELQLNKNLIGAINWEEWNTLPSLKSIDFADNPLTVVDVSKIKNYFPKIHSCNLGDAFNKSRKAEIIEESKKLNVSIKFIDYYRSYV
ncbi:leucine-rich repeat-containing G-protein coupled receptor 5-like [Harmonia axyridis]|uniref:leucine-rich repeat-containing G-protein coupled receptor 5-like n=1 Tax=Harmonia axyridis TaxID=115357 RepID=UPI001E2766DF|nr:leucine-rich repeat-containing G-protein coupled receptor 5-like [Harmonia axyridis]